MGNILIAKRERIKGHIAITPAVGGIPFGPPISIGAFLKNVSGGTHHRGSLTVVGNEDTINISQFRNANVVVGTFVMVIIITLVIRLPRSVRIIWPAGDRIDGAVGRHHPRTSHDAGGVTIPSTP